jgi:hypothetical protein
VEYFSTDCLGGKPFGVKLFGKCVGDLVYWRYEG